MMSTGLRGDHDGGVNPSQRSAEKRGQSGGGIRCSTRGFGEIGAAQDGLALRVFLNRYGSR